MTSRSPVTPDRSIGARQKLARSAGFTHISEPLAAELRRLVQRLSRQGEEKKAA
jgi:hypothetical protein